MTPCYFDRMADAMGAGLDTDAAQAHANSTFSLSEGPTAEELLDDHFRHSYSVEEYDLLILAVKYLLPFAPESARKHVVEILQP